MARPTRETAKPAIARHVANRDGTPVEWVIVVLAGLMTLALVGFLAFDALTRPSGAAILSVHLDRLEPVGTAQIAHLTLANAGPETATEIAIIARSANGGELAYITIDHVAPDGRRAAAVIVPAGLAEADLVLSVAGFTRP